MIQCFTSQGGWLLQNCGSSSQHSVANFEYLAQIILLLSWFSLKSSSLMSYYSIFSNKLPYLLSIHLQISSKVVDLIQVLPILYIGPNIWDLFYDVEHDCLGNTCVFAWEKFLFNILTVCWWCVYTQPCSILCNPMDYSPPSFSVHGIFQERILEWNAISYSRGSSSPKHQTPNSCIGRSQISWYLILVSKV